MRIFDLHCDTLTRCLDNEASLLENDGQLDLTRGNHSEAWVQVFACWLDTNCRGEAAYRRFLSQRAVLTRALADSPGQAGWYDPDTPPLPGRCAAVLAVEGGQALAGRLCNIAELARLGVRLLTLLWNGDNELGSGAVNGSGGGLTPFGRECVPELERCGILADISHLNDAGVDDVFTLSRRPIVATHSNLRSVCDNPRNLRDEQFRELARQGGLCGINFWPPFVNGERDYSPVALRRHLDRMLALGGEDAVALGSDFDGASMPAFLPGIQSLAILRANVVEWYGEKIAEKLFYENAAGFAGRNFSRNAIAAYETE